MEFGCRIEMLGTLRVVQGEQRIERFRTQKTASLLAYLAYYRQRSHPREELIERFWPDLPLPAARDSLSTALSALRRQLEPSGVPAGSVLTADRWNVRLHPELVTTDVADFERLLDEAASEQTPPHPSGKRQEGLQQALALYRGDLLPGLYEDWIVREQIRLHERYTDALQHLALLQEEAGAWEVALDTASKVIAADPYNEAGYRARMRLCTALGRPGVSLEAFQELEHRLKAELGVAPSQETRRLADLLRSDPATVSARKVAPNPGSTGISFQTLPSVARPPEHALPPTLPLHLTRFFGRDQELQQLERWLFPAAPLPLKRLITLTGPGGAGKTRLAVEAASRLSGAYSGRVLFVSLAGLTAPFLLPYAVAHALQLAPTSQNDTLDPIIAALAVAPSLLVLDNFEHLLRTPSIAEFDPPKTGSAALFVRLLLERVPGLTCLITSREILRLSGEQEWTVAPLSLPGAANDPEGLLAFDSVALYVDRAQAVLPNFAVTTRNAREVAEICRRLEGLPLAIEMAAAWARTLPPAQMLSRLENRLNLPVNPLRDLPPRHHSLRATIEWSYDLLPARLQGFFARLSVFCNGWTLEAADAVIDCGAKQVDSVALEMLAELRERSLVVMEEGADQARFRLLETLREFAAEKLEEAGEQERTRQRHAAYYATWVQQRGIEEGMPDAAEALQQLEREYENLRAALDWYSQCQEEAEAYLKFCTALFPFWNQRGHLTEGRKYLREALAATQGSTAESFGFQQVDAFRVRQDAWPKASQTGTFSTRPREALASTQSKTAGKEETSPPVAGALMLASGLKIRGEGLYAAGALAVAQSDYDQAQALLEESLALARQREDPAGIAAALLPLGAIAQYRGDYPQAIALLEESLALCQGLQQPWRTASLLIRLGTIARNQKEFERAQTLLEEALAISRRLDDKRHIAAALMNLGLVLRRLKMRERAVPMLEESLTLLRVQGDKPGLALVLGNLGVLANDQDDYDRAERFYCEALAIDYELGNRRAVALSFTNLANSAHRKGLAERSITLCVASEALFESLGIPRTPDDYWTMKKRLANLRKTMGKEAYDAACASASALTLEQAIAYALALP